MSFLVMS